MKKFFLLMTAGMLSTVALASASRYLDGQYITNGANTITVPNATGTMVLRDDAVTLTNKTMSGANNTFSNIPVTAIGDGTVLSGTNTGDVTLGTANGLSLSGQVLSLGLASGSANGALSSTDWTTFNNKLTSPLTTKGDLLVYGSTNERLGVGSDGQILVADSGEAQGMKWTNSASVLVTVVGSTGSPEAITAAGGVSYSSTTPQTIQFLEGSGGAVTVTANPQVAAGTVVGSELILIGESDTNTVTFADGNGLSLNGTWVAAAKSSITLVWDGTVWVEISRR